MQIFQVLSQFPVESHRRVQSGAYWKHTPKALTTMTLPARSVDADPRPNLIANPGWGVETIYRAVRGHDLLQLGVPREPRTFSLFLVAA